MGFDSLTLKHIDELWSKHHPEILNDIAKAKQDETPPSPVRTSASVEIETPVEQPSTPKPHFAPEIPVAPRKPRNMPRPLTRKKSFQLVKTNEALRDIVKNNRTDRIVSIMEQFKDNGDDDE